VLSPDVTAELTGLLCAHFGVARPKARLQMATTNRTGFFGPRRHLRITLFDGSRRYEAFGKITSRNQVVRCRSVYGALTPEAGTECRNLQSLRELLPTADMIPAAIGVVDAGDTTLCVLAYLGGFRNLSGVLSTSAFRRATGRRAVLEDLGRAVLDRIHALQTACSTLVESPLDAEYEALGRTLQRTSMLSADQKRRVLAAAERARPARVRMGLIHGDLGTRNVLLRDGHAVIVDWEGMQRDRLALYDPCYFISTLLMRGVQLRLPLSVVRQVRTTLLDHLVMLEREANPDGDTTHEELAVRFAEQLAQAHLLASYERDLGRGGAWSWLKQRKRQLEFLVHGGGLASPALGT